MKRINRLVSVIFLMLTFVFVTACGVWKDMAEDGELRWGIMTAPNYISPYKLKVAVLPFKDEVNLGATEAAVNTASLLGVQLSRGSHLTVIPMEEVLNKIGQKSFDPNLDKDEIIKAGKILDVNIVVVGSINEISNYEQRKNWRRAFKFLTSQRGYVDAVIAASAFDVHTGVMLASRATEGNFSQASEEKDYFSDDKTLSPPSQEAIETSLERAIWTTRHRLVDGISQVPFKTEITSIGGNEVIISQGSEVGIDTGDKLYVHSVSDVLTNAIGEQYVLPGEVKAILKVIKVEEGLSCLEVLEGSINSGDIVQSSVL